MIHSSLSLTKCKRHELEALLKFKHSVTQDPQRLLSTWVGDDCCQWRGISCDNVTGNVIKLSLGTPQGGYFGDYTTSLVSAKLSSALLELKFLSHLDLSGNNFTGSRIPEFVGSMTKLRYLDFSSAVFSGPIPPQIGNLTNLMHLDLGDAGGHMLYTEQRLEWASRLSKLQFLDMSSINMSQTYDSLQVLFTLPSLLQLTLYDCLLDETHLSNLLIENSSTLQFLDVHYNKFNGPFPSFLKNMPFLQTLYLSENSFSGNVPNWLDNLSSLEYLDLAYNEFHGTVPASSLAKLSSLKYVDLSNNRLTGLIQDIFGYLRHLAEMDYLDISSNSIQGTISHIGNLSKLSYWNMNYNSIKLNLSTNWRPPFQLQFLGARSCEINMPFPQWLRNQTQISTLDLSNTGISGELPQWLGNFTNLYYLKLAGNKLTGSLPRHVSCDGCNLQWLDLHHNMLTGTIPHWLKHPKAINVLDLSENFLSGGISGGDNASSLLSGNNYLYMLDLSDNMLSGEIQVTIANTYSGGFLEFLSLRGNDFSGVISRQLCRFSYLIVLELAHNRLTGNIPHCLGSVIFQSGFGYSSSSGINTQEIIKGTTENFNGTISTHSMIDLSCNRLVGMIPEELANITNLMQLNLSNNHLTGGILDDIGNLKLLESLDLSNNYLSGTIPQSLSDIPWLSVLNLSNNHLYGQIPTGRQLQTLDNPSIYAGNPGLCGFPLPNKCSERNLPLSPTDENHRAKDKLDKLWLYLAVMSGVATGFWGVILTLVFKKSWRHAYFRFVEDTADKIYVPVKIRLNKFKNRQRNVIEI
ncbi:hypothetical protein KSS87_003181 [Heliosperma pusillum]|nr:hypothetical protein KSS87_003181 [Heliosperma pusillum]